MEEHIPVLLREVLYFLEPGPGKRYIDATVGGGGHAEAILKAGGEVLGIDQDPRALEIAKRRLLSCPGRYRTVPAPGVFKLVNSNFSKLAAVARSANFTKVDGVLFDLGLASFQIGDPSLGLSFVEKGPLDMRLSPDLGVTAKDLVNSLPERQLYELLRKTDERYARAIARAIVRRRSLKPFVNTLDLAQVVQDVYGRRTGKIHPATKTFLALRMAVNLELENLTEGLAQALEALKPRGRLVVISFHSGEDRLVKDFFKEKAISGIFKILTKKPVSPSDIEIDRNPRARSAKLRAGEKI